MAITVVFAVLASPSLMDSALAEDRVNVIPTLYREQARATATVGPASELTTIPSLTPVASQAQLLGQATAR